RTVHGEFMWPFTARVNEKPAPIERIAAVAICRRLPPRCASQKNRTFNVRFGSKADMCSAKRHVRFTPNSDRESGIPQKAMSALPPKADMCGATVDVRFGPIADIDNFIGLLRWRGRPAKEAH